MKKVAVGSTNPIKLSATQLAFEAVWPKEQWEVIGMDVVSGVPDQPMSDQESVRGASNRALNVFHLTTADFSIGLEGGIQKIGSDYFGCGWMIVIDKNGRKGVGSTARMLIPAKAMELVLKGGELGPIYDSLFGTKNIKHAGGYFALMTNNNVSRESAYTDAIIFALSAFLHPDLFNPSYASHKEG